MNQTLPEDPLFNLLNPERLTAVVDIGANPVDGEPPYKQMLSSGLCTVVGFEPQEDALKELLRARGPRETYLPDAVGDGLEHTLFLCRASGMTSFYRPNQRYLSLFNDFTDFGQVVGQEVIKTRRLDDIAEISAMDYLKIDIQGSELSVFQSGRSRLSQAVVVQTEVSFMPLYEGQPLFWEVDREMREQGFIPHAFDAVKRWPISPFRDAQNARKPLNQLLEADVVYVRDFLQAEDMQDEQLKQLALIGHHVYGSYDLVLRCIDTLVDREVLQRAAVLEYSRMVGASPIPQTKGDPAGNLADYSINITFSQ